MICDAEIERNFRCNLGLLSRAKEKATEKFREFCQTLQAVRGQKFLIVIGAPLTAEAPLELPPPTDCHYNLLTADDRLGFPIIKVRWIHYDLILKPTLITLPVWLFVAIVIAWPSTLDDMAEPENLLTNAEVWDDSALIDSWNEALEEYKVHLL